MTKKYTYTYTCEIEFDFDRIIEEYGLDKTSGPELCYRVVNIYISSNLDDEECCLIDNQMDIARELYHYIQSKNN